jgi:hypothetical protein
MKLLHLLPISLLFLAFTPGKDEKKYILRGDEIHTDIAIEDHSKCVEYVYEYDMVHVDSISHQETDKLLHIVVINKELVKAGETYDLDKTKNLHLDYSTFIHLNRCWYKSLHGTVKILKKSGDDHLSLQLNLSAVKCDGKESQKVLEKTIKW